MSRVQADAVLFDLDDTLLNRSVSLRGFTRKLLQTFAAELGDCDEDSLYQMIRKSDDSGYRPRPLMAQELLLAVKWARKVAESEIVDFWYQEFPLCSVLEDRAAEVLSYLRGRGISTGIVTNGSRDVQMAKLRHVGMEKQFEVVVISGEVGIRKPDPRIFRLAVEMLKSSPSRTVFVGDNPADDIIGARDAGLTPIWKRARLSWPAGMEKPELQIVRLEELIGMI